MIIHISLLYGFTVFQLIFILPDIAEKKIEGSNTKTTKALNFEKIIDIFCVATHQVFKFRSCLNLDFFKNSFLERKFQL